MWSVFSQLELRWQAGPHLQLFTAQLLFFVLSEPLLAGI